MPSQTTPLLQLHDVALGYDAPNILTQVNLSVNAGDVVALVGQNGVGKSSLLAAIMGLIPEVRGQITFDGQPLNQKKTYEIANAGISFVKQENAVFADLTVTEHFTLFNKPSLADNLRYFPDLLRQAHARASELSGGQRQQLAIALALASQPKLLLLDEPSANIQPSVVEIMVQRLGKINRESGMAIIVAEQNLSVIRYLAHRAYLLKSGRLLPEAIKVNPNINNRHLVNSLNNLGAHL